MGIRYRPELEPTKVPTAIDIAWSAGIWEGEGCVQAPRKARGIIVRVTQKDPELLYRLRDWFGGSITRQGVCKVWLAAGDRGRHFLSLIYPFLTARRRAQVDEISALKFLNGANPANLTSDDIWLLLDSKLSFCPKGDPMTSEKKALQKSQAYRRRRQDPAFVEKCRAQSATGNERVRLLKAAVNQPERIM